MLLPTFRTRKKNSDFTVLHFITRRIHCSLTFTCSISRNLTVYMFWSKAKRAMITAGFLRFWDFFSTIEAGKGFIDRFHTSLFYKIYLLESCLAPFLSKILRYSASKGATSKLIIFAPCSFKNSKANSKSSW